MKDPTTDPSSSKEERNVDFNLRAIRCHKRNGTLVNIDVVDMMEGSARLLVPCCHLFNVAAS
jgi:hypothetical protein